MLFGRFNRKKNSLYIDHQILKILLIIDYVILISAFFVVLITPPASGYEFSIYTAYPTYFWFLVITSIFMGYFCTIFAVLGKSTFQYWSLGFLAAMIAICLLLFLPIIHGYFMYGSGDVLTHIGYMVDIENNGSIGRNHYPILHILGFTVHETTGLPFNIIIMIIPPVISILSILFWYILGREIFDNNIGVLFLVILGSLPIFGVSNSLFAPNNQAILFVPLILYILIKYQNIPVKKEISIALITLSVLIVFFHPLVSIIVMSIYALLYFSEKYFIIISQSESRISNIWIITVIMAIIFSIWSTYIYLLAKVLDPFISSIMGSDVLESELMGKINLISIVDVDIIYLIKLGLLTYGIDIILGLLSIICILYLFILNIRCKIIIDRYLIFFIICFIAFFTLGVSLFITIKLFDSARIFRIARIFSLIIISSAIYIQLKNINNIKKMLLITFFCVLVIMLIVLSAFTLHVSPIIKKSNQQVPESDYYGMVTFFEKRDDSLEIVEYGISQMRYYVSIYGVNPPRINIRYSREGDLLPPDHFGYNLFYHLGLQYHEKKYLLLNDIGKYFYENIYPEFPDNWRFVDKDYEMIESDTSINRIYSNDNLNVLLISPKSTL